MNGVTDPHIDTAFNKKKFFGANQKMAVVEGGANGLWEPHEAFSQVTLDPVTGQRVTYEVEPKDCPSGVVDCPDQEPIFGDNCDDLGHAGHPVQCYRKHASKVASVAFGTNGGKPYGTALARLYFPNKGDKAIYPSLPDPTVRCSAAGLADAYDWLQGQGVHTTNESWTCAQNPEMNPLVNQAEGLVQDWYARLYDFSIFKAAGNRGSPDPASEAACPFSLNSTCVGSIETNGLWSPFSNWTNNNDYTNPLVPVRTDREEPDLVALGGDSGMAMTDVLYPGLLTSWTADVGTSFATPAMMAVAALLKEKCGGPTGELNHNWLRAVMRSAAWGRNPRDYRYSTAVTSPPLDPAYDWRDGAGALFAENAAAFCGPGGGGGVKTQVSSGGSLSNGTPPPFGIPCDPCGHPVPLGGQSLHLQGNTPPGPNDGRLYNLIFQGKLHAGQRFRVTLAFDSCPTSKTGKAPATVATDIDLVWAKLENGIVTPMWSSQSVADSVEGFDVIVPTTADWQLYWTYPQGALGCSQSPGFEPWVAAWVYGNF